MRKVKVELQKPVTALCRRKGQESVADSCYWTWRLDRCRCRQPGL